MRRLLTQLRTSEQGTTLVELLVSVLLFAIVGFSGIAFFISVLTGSAKAQANIDVQANARLAMQRIMYEIRRASDIEGTSTFDANLVSGGSLDLDMPDAPRDPTVIDVSGGVVRLTQGAGSPIELTSDDVTVTNLTFNERSPANNKVKVIRMTLTITKPDPTGTSALDIVYTVKSTAKLRNF